MERAVSCYLPPSCYSPPLSKLSVGSWASLPLHLLNPGPAQLSSDPVPHRPSSTAAFQHLSHNSRTDPSENTLPAPPLILLEENSSSKKGSQLPLFSMHILYAEIVFARATTDRKQKILAPGCWQGKLFPRPRYWQGIFFLFPPLLTPVLLHWKLSLQQDAGQTNTRPQAS